MVIAQNNITKFITEQIAIALVAKKVGNRRLPQILIVTAKTLPINAAKTLPINAA
jgi:hypothetical protein